MTMADTSEADLRSRYEAAGQGHVFKYVENLTNNEKDIFFSQLESIDVEGLAFLLESARNEPTPDSSTIQPFSGHVGRPSTDGDNNCYSTGMTAIQGGEVAALVLAGGQGTRLGFGGPKGCYDISLPSGKTLFQIMAERIKKLGTLADNKGSFPVPFYIMTSPINHQETVSFFASKDFFGLGSSNVVFFQQGMLPCMNDEGKIILETAGKVAMAPDGNGGIYPSLKASGALDDMKKRGAKYLHVFSIDNALVKPADPVFIGYCIEQQADCGNKVVWKANSFEKVGVVATRDGKPCIVEYSEITTEMAEKMEQGRLVYGAGNICNHFYSLQFICDSILPNMGNLYHIAHKKIPCYDEKTTKTVIPTSNNGIKLETFIFDVFPYSQRMAVLDIDRNEEFAPVKNKSGSDSPETAREMISALAKKWILDAGGKLSGDESSVCEISPLTSYAGEGLEEFAKDKEIACPFCL